MFNSVKNVLMLKCATDGMLKHANKSREFELESQREAIVGSMLCACACACL